MAPSPVVSPGPESPYPSGDLLPAVPDAGRGVQPSTDVVGDAQLAIGDVLDDMLLDGVAAALPFAAALGMASLTAVSIARGVCSPGAAVMFTNVRLVPCLVGSAVERTAMVGSQAVSRLGSNGTTRGTNATARKRAAVPAIVGTIVDPIRDGFESVVARPRAEDAEGLRDARLLMQIGIVLGTIYLAFLTVWFWATRVRLKPRAVSDDGLRSGEEAIPMQAQISTSAASTQSRNAASPTGSHGSSERSRKKRVRRRTRP